MKTKYFGRVKATIDTDKKRIKLYFTKPGKQPLDAGHPARCLNWAISALQPYTAKGFVISGPEAAPGG